MIRSFSVRPLWSVGENVNVPPMPTNPAGLLDLVAQRRGREVALHALGRLGDEVERVVGVTGERARLLAVVGGRVALDEVGRHLVGLGVRAVALGQQDLAGREDEALGRVAGAVDELLARVAVRAVERHLDAELLGLLDDGRGLLARGDDEHRLGVGALDLRQLRGDVGVAGVERLARRRSRCRPWAPRPVGRRGRPCRSRRCR